LSKYYKNSHFKVFGIILIVTFTSSASVLINYDLSFSESYWRIEKDAWDCRIWVQSIYDIILKIMQIQKSNCMRLLRGK